MSEKLKCKWFGHKWRPVYINKLGKFKLIGSYCQRCYLGYDELMDFVIKNKPITNSYNFECWYVKTVVFLIPSRTDTICWHKFCMKATEIRFIQGRLKFDDCENPAPFPSCIVIFKNEGERGQASSHLTARSGMGWSGCLKKEIV